MRECLVVHAAACVRDGQHDVVAAPDADVARGVLLVEVYVRGLDGQLAAAGHRIARVDAEVK